MMKVVFVASVLRGETAVDQLMSVDVDTEAVSLCNVKLRGDNLDMRTM